MSFFSHLLVQLTESQWDIMGVNFFAVLPYLVKLLHSASLFSGFKWVGGKIEWEDITNVAISLDLFVFLASCRPSCRVCRQICLWAFLGSSSVDLNPKAT